MLSTILLTALIPQVSITPADRNSEQWWSQRHLACVEKTKKADFDIAFIGDSITQGWEGAGKPTWDKEFAPLKSANFGFSGDRTEHVLWRLANGEIVGANPKLIVIMIGTNNLGHGSSNAQQTALGVKTIVHTIRQKLPSTKILLLGIFPRGRTTSDPYRISVADATSQFKDVADGNMVWFLDIGKTYLRPSGDLRDTLMPDLLHLSPGGYELWAMAIKPTMLKMLK